RRGTAPPAAVWQNDGERATLVAKHACIHALLDLASPRMCSRRQAGSSAVPIRAAMKQIIFTADDFGLCEEINEAVEVAHRAGVLSAASLMVSAPAAKDAISRAQRLRSLRVGLHIVLVDGRPTLPPGDIPQLVDADGAFPSDLLKAAIRWAF